jgi:ATP-dependent DNA helicase RecG
METYLESESATLEFKAEVPRYDQIVKTVIAFCNLFGGRLILGVADDRRIVGIPENNVEELSQAIHHSIFQSSSPTILPTIYTQRTADKLLLIIEVTAGMNKPYFKLSEGLSKGTYIRVGASTVRAGPEIIDELKWKNRGKSFDQTPLYTAQVSDLDREKIKDFLKSKAVHHSGTISNAVLESYDLVVSEHGKMYPTVGGMLLFAANPQKYLSEAFIIASEFGSEDFSKTIATRDCNGTVMEQIDQAISFVSTRLNVTYETRKTKRSERLEVPLSALREIIVNAVLHRSYNVSGPVKVAIYPNRIEVFSPGGFPGPLSVSQIGAGITYIRNIVLAKVLREAGYVEKLGSGFKILFEACAAARLKQPIVFEGDNFVKCTVWRLPLEKGVQAEPIQLLVEKMGEVTTADVQKHCGISRATAVRRLAELVRSRKIQRIGKGPSTRYIAFSKST